MVGKGNLAVFESSGERGEEREGEEQLLILILVVVGR